MIFQRIERYNSISRFITVSQTHAKSLNRSENSTKSSDFNLVCPNGGIARVDDWQRCNFGMEPPRVIVSFAGKSANALEELTHGVLAASSLYVKNPDYLRLFGTWAGQSNILFKVWLLSLPLLFTIITGLLAGGFSAYPLSASNAIGFILPRDIDGEEFEPRGLLLFAYT
jgi:hypothetical protein